MATLDLEGRAIQIEAGDTIASALYRAGVRVFSRSFKFHRPRGLYCLTGDCPNCLVTVDGQPCERACVTPAAAGQRVVRENAWPSVDFDLLSVFWYLRWLLPVGFYYKTMKRPRAMWPLAEPIIRRIAGIGSVSQDLPPTDREACHHHPDLCVVGGGVAGLSAALAAAGAGRSVILVDEDVIGAKVPPGLTRTKIDELREALRAQADVTVLERATAVGIYEGPLVPVSADDLLHLIHPTEIVVATGAVERHAVFPGSDLVGVWLGRGAARMAGAHSLAVGRTVVFAGVTSESLHHIETLLEGGVDVAAAALPEHLADRLPAHVRWIPDGRVVAARGRKRLGSVVVESGDDRENLPCDGLVLSLGLVGRDGLLRQGMGLPVVGAGEVVAPGCELEVAIASGRDAALGVSGPAPIAALPPSPTAGIACLCEDVTVGELCAAWREGFRSTELLKRYTTATMGPCQGALCHPYLRAFVEGLTDEHAVSGPTTARPPARPVRLEDVAAGARFVVEQRTALHKSHLALGAEMAWAGAWKRPDHYGDELKEYWAVRRNASVMDVGTLGKFLVAGPDATEFLERLYPGHVHDIAEGRLRYSVLLNEAGYIFDDGLICSLGPRGYYLTLTSAGAEHGEAWLQEWAAEWKLKVHVVNRTAELGAINVAGPRAREFLARLTADPIDNGAFPYARHRKIEVAGVPCRALRLGFVGEMSFELHHPSSHSRGLWDTLLSAGADIGLVPHGVQALTRLCLEKGHIIVGQDTDFDTTPAKIGYNWVTKMEKPYFIGKTALERLARLPLDMKLLPMTFPGVAAPREGTALESTGRHVGHITSSRFSPVLEHGVALGWLRRTDGEFATEVRAVTERGAVTGAIVAAPFYDPRGEKLRG